MGYLEALPVTRILPVGYWPFFLGTLRDVSEYGNHGAVAAPLYWTSYGDFDAVRSDGVGYVSVAHSASIGSGGRGSLVMSGFMGTQYTWKNFFRKVTGGSRLQFYCNSATQIELFDGTNNSNLTADINNARSVVVTWPDTGNPSFYIDGVFAGLGSVAVTVPATAGVLMIGGDAVTGSCAHIASAFQYNEVLTPSEISDLHTWSQSRFTPRKQWPGGGLRYPDRETNEANDGDMEEAGTGSWTPNAGAILNKVAGPTGQRLQVEYSGPNNPSAAQGGTFTVGRQYLCTVDAWSDGSAVPRMMDASAGIDVSGTTSTDKQELRFLGMAKHATLFLRATTAAPGMVWFDNLKVWTNPPGYTHRTGDPLFIDNIQTARVTLVDEVGPSTQLSNCGLAINTGTWALAEDVVGKYILCVAAGQLQYDLIGAAGYVVDLFTEEGGATLTLNANNFQLDAGNGDIIRAVRIVNG